MMQQPLYFSNSHGKWKAIRLTVRKKKVTSGEIANTTLLTEKMSDSAAHEKSESL